VASGAGFSVDALELGWEAAASIDKQRSDPIRPFDALRTGSSLLLAQRSTYGRLVDELQPGDSSLRVRCGPNASACCPVGPNRAPDLLSVGRPVAVAALTILALGSAVCWSEPVTLTQPLLT
jgi:hypothetical protein